MTTIGCYAFSSCKEIETISIYSETPPSIVNNTFEALTYTQVDLYVPKGCAEKYKSASSWSKFAFIYEIKTGSEDNESDQCAAPTITYGGDKINFACSTERATIHYTISPQDNKSGDTVPGDVEISGLYDITAYTTAEGKIPSEIITQQVKCAAGVVEVEKIVEVEVPVEVEKIVEVHDTIEVEKLVEVEVPVEVEKLIEVHDTIFVYDDSRSAIKLPSGEVIMLTIKDGVIHIEDAPTESTIYVYSLAGEMIEMRKVYEKDTELRLPRNATYIIKTCDKTFKVKI